VNTTRANYRGIALSSILGKLFDNIIFVKCSAKLSTSDLQFGFKRNSSTHRCTMVLKETISYYITNNINVFCTFLDASKAFDRVHYCKLFRLVLQRGLPACIVRVLIKLYVGHVIRASWAGLLSSSFNAVNGVKQGGVLSPVLFCIYIDGLLTKLSESGVGCYISWCLGIGLRRRYCPHCSSPSDMRKLLAICDGMPVIMILFSMLINQSLLFLLVLTGVFWSRL